MRLFRQVIMNDELLEPLPFKRELAMQAYVLEHPQILKLDDKYNDAESHDEEITIKSGRIDMVATYSREHIAIIEFKKEKLEKKHLKQLKRYLDNREELQDRDSPIIAKDDGTKPKWIGILIGTSIDPVLEKNISSGNLKEYDIPKGVPIAAITIERFSSAKTGNVYVTTDTYFKSRPNKDFTEYWFNGGRHKKGRLVLAVIKEHIEQNPQITYDELLKAFPQSLAKTNKIFKTYKEAYEIYTKTNIKRHFIDVEKKEPIKLIDYKEPLVVSSQWGDVNIVGFIERATELGYKIK